MIFLNFDVICSIECICTVAVLIILACVSVSGDANKSAERDLEEILRNKKSTSNGKSNKR